MFLPLLLLWEAYGKLIFFFAFSSPLNLRIEEASEEEEKGGIIPKAETNERTKADGWMDGWIFFFIRFSPLFFLPSTGVAPVPRLFSPPPPPFMQIAYFVSPSSPFFSRYGSLTWIEDGGREKK